MFLLIFIELAGSLSMLVHLEKRSRKKQLKWSHGKILSVTQHFKLNKRASI